MLSIIVNAISIDDRSDYAYATPSGFSGDSQYTPVQCTELHGFLNVDVSSDGTTLVGKFYDNDAEEIKDQFTITK